MKNSPFITENIHDHLLGVTHGLFLQGWSHILHWFNYCGCSIRDVLPISAPMVAAYAACHMTKLCNASAFSRCRRSMLASDMLSALPEIFSNQFDSQS